jgi:tRNA(Ile)-lysidine synthase
LHQLAQSDYASLLLAVHIQDGVSVRADEMRVLCRQTALDLGVAYDEQSVVVVPDGLGLEAAARQVRYAALLEYMLDNSSVLLTAHHAQDQAETVILHLMRGSGVRGLAAMPLVKSFGLGYHIRPLLNTSKKVLESYAKQHGIVYIEDETNQDLQYDRNFIRHVVLPLLQTRWPRAIENVHYSAQYCSEALGLLTAQTQADYQACWVADSQTLNIPCLQQYSAFRQAEVVAYWLRARGFVGLPRKKNDFLLRALQQQRRLILQHEHYMLRVYRQQLWVDRMEIFQPKALKSEQVKFGEPVYLAHLDQSLTVDLEGGSVLAGDAFEIQYRQGGERLRPKGRGGSVSLKKLFQEKGVPPWMRDQIPLIVHKGQIIAIPGICVGEGIEGVVVTWGIRSLSGEPTHSS